MSDTDSFIDEVNDELRQDQLYKTFRKWAPAAAAVVLLIVGGATWNEVRNARADAAAAQLGDSILTALESDGEAEQLAALTGIETDGGGQAIVDLLAAGIDEDAETSAARLDSLVTNDAVPDIYKDLARLKAAMVADVAPGDRVALLEPLANPGEPFRLLAMEQMALSQLEAGDADAGVATLRSILEDAGLTDGQRRRLLDLMQALGQPFETAEG